MRIYLLRHGDAEPGGAIRDHDRELTPNGSKRLEAAAKVIDSLGIKPTHIFSSPRVRAQQTAKIIAAALKHEVEIRDEVNFSFDVRAIQSLVAGLDDDAEVIFVGHNPSFSQVVTDLTGADVTMKKGGLARIDLMHPGMRHGELVWLIAPKVFDALAGS